MLHNFVRKREVHCLMCCLCLQEKQGNDCNIVAMNCSAVGRKSCQKNSIPHMHNKLKLCISMYNSSSLSHPPTPHHAFHCFLQAGKYCHHPKVTASSIPGVKWSHTMTAHTHDIHNSIKEEVKKTSCLLPRKAQHELDFSLSQIKLNACTIPTC